MSDTYWPSHPTIPLQEGSWRTQHPTSKWKCSPRPGNASTGDNSVETWFPHPRDTSTTFFVEVGRWDINAERGKWLRQVSSFAIPASGVSATIDFFIGLVLEEMDIDAAAEGFLLVGFTDLGDRVRFDPASHVYSVAEFIDRRFILQLTDSGSDASIPIQVFGLGLIPPRPVENTPSARAWHPNMHGHDYSGNAPQPRNEKLSPGDFPWDTSEESQRPSDWMIPPGLPRRADLPRAPHLDTWPDHLNWHIGTLWTPLTWGGVHGGPTTRRWQGRNSINHDRHHGDFNSQHGHIPYEWITRYRNSTVRKEEASRYEPDAPTSTVTIWKKFPTLAAITLADHLPDHLALIWQTPPVPPTITGDSILSPWIDPVILAELGVGLPATGAREAHHSAYTAIPNVRPSGTLPHLWFPPEPEEEPIEWWFQEALEWTPGLTTSTPAHPRFPPGSPWAHYIDPIASPERQHRPSTHLLARARNALIRQENHHTSRERKLVLLWWRLCRRQGLARMALRSTSWWSDSEYSDSHPSPRESSGRITPPSGSGHPEEEVVIHPTATLPIEVDEAPELPPPSAAKDKWQEAAARWAHPSRTRKPGAEASDASSSWE